MSDPINVEPGQVWADKQKGEEGRAVRVVAVDGRYATVELATASRHSLTKPIGRKSRILVDQIPRRFRLVPQSEAEVGHA
jgi:predicted RNA-binding protein with PUA domain